MVQIAGRITNQTKELLAELRHEFGLKSDGDAVDFLASQYQKGSQPKPQATGQQPKSSDSLFVAKIDPRDHQLIGEFVDHMYDQHGYKEPQILRYFAKLQKALTDKKVHLLKLPKAVNERLLAIAEPKVDNGDVQSINHYLSNLLKSALPQAEDRKKSTWF
jgi:hypothetical protein